MAKIRKTLEEKFLSRVQKTDTCWLWVGHKNAYGYGTLHLTSKLRVMAHRLSYTLFIGPFDEALDILHSCDNPACVNPSHLRPGTHDENMKDMVVRARSLRGEAHNISKLKEDDIRQIRLLSKDKKMRSPQIAKIFNVTEANIRHIIGRKTWKHV